MKSLALVLYVLFPFLLFSQNLSNNPGFEIDTHDMWGNAGANGYPDGWWERVYAFRETNPDHVRSGTASFRLEGPVDSANPGPGEGHIFNSDNNFGFDDLEDNTTYLMRAWVKSENMTSGFFRMFHNSSPYPPAGYPTVTYNEESTDWKLIQTYFTTTDNGGNPIDGNLHFHTDIPSGAKVWVDDVTFIKVEPYSIHCQASNTTLMADGSSFSTISVKIYDEWGNFLDGPGIDNEITFSLTGPGSLVGANPAQCVNGITAISYVSGTTTGQATITAESPGLQSCQVTIDLIDYGHSGVPELPLDYNGDVEDDWWANHVFNPDSPTYNPNILSQFTDGTPYTIYDVTNDYGGSLQNALDAVPLHPDSAAVVLLQGGTTYQVPTTGLEIAGRNHIHFIAENGNATIQAPSGFTGIPRDNGSFNNTMINIQGQPGDWHDDNYASDYALANRTRDFYFKNIIFDANNQAGTGVSIWTAKDIVFDNCEFVGATGIQELHSGAWGDNIWVRGCHFYGTASHAILLDGTHGSGVLNCSIDYDYYPSAVEFFSNDDCSRDVNDNGIWDPEEMRLGNYIAVVNNSFGENGSNNVSALGAAARNFLVCDNTVYGNGHRFVSLQSRCSQMVHGPLMPSYEYEFVDARIVNNTVFGSLNEFVAVYSSDDQSTQDSPRSRCTGYERPYETSDGGACTSVIGRYQIRGNVAPGFTNQSDFVDEYPNNLDPIAGPNVVCGNCNSNDPTCQANPYPGCQTPAPTYSHLGCYSNSGAVRFYLDGTNGDDANDGTSSTQAWQTLKYALDNMTPASTLIIREGIYEVDNSDPASRPIIGKADRSAEGVDEDNATIVKAADGEFVLVTGDDGKAPSVTIAGDFIRVEGIWFGGGDWDNATHGFGFSGGGLTSGIDHGREIIGCTFFGFRDLSAGYVEDTFFQANRFIRCGKGLDPPGL
ncbi:hypothetical protein GF406_14685, partial [candidate division KSB1 bacterium]|nr:hypothetical protein [candidate division KSB1 bacterium]